MIVDDLNEYGLDDASDVLVCLVVWCRWRRG